MASPASGDPSPSSGVVASDGAVVADAALVPTARRTRFAPKVPSERRTRAARDTGTGEDTAEPKLSTHVEHLVKQAHLDGKTTRPREAVRGLEQRPRRGEGDLSKPGDTSAGGGGPGGTSTSAMDGLGTFLGNPGGAPSSQTHTPASFSAGKGGKMKEERHEKEPKSASAASGSRVEKHEQTHSHFQETMPASPMDAGGDGDVDVDKDWTDKTQYYPTVLRACPEPSAGTSANNVDREDEDEIDSVAARLRRTETNDEYLVVQLPSLLSLARTQLMGGDEDDLQVVGTKGGNGQSDRMGNQSDKMDADGFGTNAAAWSELDEGKLGDLEVRKDGSVRLCIGGTSFDVVQGTHFAHVEQLACVDSKPGNAGDAKCAFLGKIPGRLVVIPDVASLLKGNKGR